MNTYEYIPKKIVNNGSEFYMSRGIGAGCVSAFRKDTWEDVGEWNNCSTTTGNSDISFASRILKNGYFIVNPISSNVLVRNSSSEKTGNIDSSMASSLKNRPRTYDCSYTRLFNLCSIDNSESVKSMSNEDLCVLLSEKRHHVVDKLMQYNHTKPEGETNTHYWQKYCEDLVDMRYNINWEIAKRHGQYKWKDEIEKCVITGAT